MRRPAVSRRFLTVVLSGLLMSDFAGGQVSFFSYSFQASGDSLRPQALAPRAVPFRCSYAPEIAAEGNRLFSARTPLGRGLDAGVYHIHGASGANSFEEEPPPIDFSGVLKDAFGRAFGA